MTEKLTDKNKGLRNNEYYGIQEQLDNLYERSKAGKKFKNLMNLIVSDDNIINKYSPNGRALIHKSLSVTSTELEILRNTPMGRGERATVELYDNRIALYIAQKGKCPISGQELLRNHHVHHKQKWSITHDDSYTNLVLVIPEMHELIHATNRKIIDECLSMFKIDKEHLEKLNKFRILVGNEIISEMESVPITKELEN